MAEHSRVIWNFPVASRMWVCQLLYWKWGCWQQCPDLSTLLPSWPTHWTDLGNHDRVNAHLLEATGVVQHVSPAQRQGEDHGSHVQFLATEVQHHRAQEEQGVNKAERQVWSECRVLIWPQVVGKEEPHKVYSRMRDSLKHKGPLADTSSLPCILSLLKYYSSPYKLLSFPTYKLL